MKYTWCVCDLDGTLLNSQNQISPENKKALEVLVQTGVQLVIATGRSNLMVKEFIDELEIKTPVISCNGGMIQDNSTGEILYQQHMKEELVFEIIKYCEMMNYEFMLYTVGTIYYSAGNKRFYKYNIWAKEKYRVPLQQLEEIKSDQLLQNVIKILISNVDKQIIEKLKFLFGNHKDLTLVSSGEGLLDIMASNISKGNALLSLKDKLGIELDRTIVFGDNDNDISMFDLCKLPIAVGNAEERVKHAAQYVTLSNDESGVGYAIRHYVLNEIHNDLEVKKGGLY